MRICKWVETGRSSVFWTDETVSCSRADDTVMVDGNMDVTHAHIGIWCMTVLSEFGTRLINER